MAARLGIERTATIRVRAGLSFGLAEATGQGHCGLPVAELTRATSELIETGVTRGKRLVVIVGQRKALAMAVRNGSARRRWTKLREWLRSGTPTGSPSRLGTLAVGQEQQP